MITVKVVLSIPPGREKGQSQSVICAQFWAFIFLVHANTVKVWGVEFLERLSAGTDTDGKQMQDAWKVW